MRRLLLLKMHIIKLIDQMIRVKFSICVRNFSEISYTCALEVEICPFDVKEHPNEPFCQVDAFPQERV